MFLFGERRSFSVYAACIALLILPTQSVAEEVEGFRLGMSIDQVKIIASGKQLKFSNEVPGTVKNWKAYTLIANGPAVSFCGDVLSSLTKTYDSNLHEFAQLLSRWSASLGTPEVRGSQNYSEGTQLSWVEAQWRGQDNVRRSISLMQYGGDKLRVSYSYSYIKTRCTP